MVRKCANARQFCSVVTAPNNRATWIRHQLSVNTGANAFLTATHNTIYEAKITEAASGTRPGYHQQVAALVQL